MGVCKNMGGNGCGSDTGRVHETKRSMPANRIMALLIRLSRTLEAEGEPHWRSRQSDLTPMSGDGRAVKHVLALSPLVTIPNQTMQRSLHFRLLHVGTSMSITCAFIHTGSQSVMGLCCAAYP